MNEENEENGGDGGGGGDAAPWTEEQIEQLRQEVLRVLEDDPENASPHDMAALRRLCEQYPEQARELARRSKESIRETIRAREANRTPGTPGTLAPKPRRLRRLGPRDIWRRPNSSN